MNCSGAIYAGVPLAPTNLAYTSYLLAVAVALAIFVIEIAVYAKLMNAKDLEYGIREEG